MIYYFQWKKKSAGKIYSHKDDDHLSSDSISISQTQWTVGMSWLLASSSKFLPGCLWNAHELVTRKLPKASSSSSEENWLSDWSPRILFLIVSQNLYVELHFYTNFAIPNGNRKCKGKGCFGQVHWSSLIGGLMHCHIILKRYNRQYIQYVVV